MLEAGQWRYRWHYDKCASGAERTEARVRAKAAGRDPLESEELYVRPRKQLGKMFASDKLGAVERWLLAQVGRPWAQIEGEILSRFDTRSLAGRHVVFDHLLPRRHERPEWGWVVNRHHEFHVDAHGLLRARQRRGRKRPVGIRAATVEWLADRKIVQYGKSVAHWLVPLVAIEAQVPKHFRQAARLDRHELERLARLNAAERERYVVER